jgi:hypothetical protein
MKNKSLIFSSLFIVLFFSFIFISCEKEKMDEGTSSNLQLSEEEVLLRNKLESVAQIVCHTAENISDCEEVKSGVDANIYYGQDEELRFRDILSPKESKFLKSASTIVNFSNKLSDAFIGNNLKSANVEGDDLETFVLNNNVQVYWPYSEDWDGVELPTITFNPLLPIDENIGFKKVFLSDGSYIIDTVIVNEKYCMNHPVWIINQNESDYGDIPTFINNEFKSGNITYLQSNPNLKSALVDDYNNSNKIYEIQVGEVKCTKQYDFIWNGGSDIYFKMIGSKQDGTNSAIADYSGNILSAKFKRKEIRKKNWKSYFTAINPDWSNSELDNGFIVYENDGGDKEKEFKGKLSFEISKVKVGCDFEFKYGKRDEKIYELIWERYAYFAGNKGEGDANATKRGDWKIYKAGQVEWTLPYVIRTKPY